MFYLITSLLIKSLKSQTMMVRELLCGYGSIIISFFFVDIFDFDEDMIESGVPQGETAASPFPLSSDDDEYDSSSNGQLIYLLLQTILIYNTI